MESNNAQIALPPSVTIDDVEAIWMQMKELQHTGPCTLDASQVSIITAPGVQLILSLERTLQEQNRSLALVNPTENFRETFRIMGMESKLRQWETAHD